MLNDMREVGRSVMSGGRDIRGDDAGGEPTVVNDLMQRRALLRIRGKDLLDELLDEVRYYTVCRELVVVFTDSPSSDLSLWACGDRGITYV